MGLSTQPQRHLFTALLKEPFWIRAVFITSPSRSWFDTSKVCSSPPSLTKVLVSHLFVNNLSPETKTDLQTCYSLFPFSLRSTAPALDLSGLHPARLIFFSPRLSFPPFSSFICKKKETSMSLRMGVAVFTSLNAFEELMAIFSPPPFPRLFQGKVLSSALSNSKSPPPSPRSPQVSFPSFPQL